MNFQSKELYPIPEVEQQNIEYAKLLLQDYAGETSEDTAVHLYMFQSLVLNKKYSKLANDLFHIGIVEMHHLKLLGKTIQLLGLSPEFVTYQANNELKNYWSSNNVIYATDVMDILKIDIEREPQAIEHYFSHYKIIKDPYIQNLLLRIIEDEKIHLEYFEKQLLVFNMKNKEIK